MISPSVEQSAIINNIANGISTFVSAVAGSGKTTLVLALAQQQPEKNILQLTYNRLLSTEVKQKVKNNNINNLDVYTYHSFNKSHYVKTGFTDVELQKALNSKPFANIIYDIIVIDETQDMIKLYYLFVQKIIKDNSCLSPTLLILGDEYQCIYGFKGSDARFLTKATQLYSTLPVELKLRTTYRVPSKIAAFVNNVMLKEEKLIPFRTTDEPVEYIITDPFNCYYIGNELVKKLRQGTIQPSDIFILAPSLKSPNSPAKTLERFLVSNNYKCYTPTDDNSLTSEDILNNKIVFSSFHQSKGRERKVVVVYGFDQSYFEYYARDMRQDKCPNILYVAATRASEKLYLIHSTDKLPLKFLDVKQIKNHAKIIGQKISPRDAQNSLHHSTSVTDFISFIKQKYITELTDLVNSLFETTISATNDINIPSVIESFGDFEQVSDLNGLIIPAMYERKLKGKATIEYYVEEFESDNNFMQKYIIWLQQCLSIHNIENYLFIGNFYNSMRQGIYNKLAQIESYDWLTEDAIDSAHNNMVLAGITEEANVSFEKVIVYNMGNSPFKKYLDYETNINRQEKINNYIKKHIMFFETIHFGAIIDALNDNILWEIKCVESLSLENHLQLIVYWWLQMIIDKEYEAYLVNIRTGELKKLIFDIEKVNRIIKILILNKYTKDQELNDDEFILDLRPQVPTTSNIFGLSRISPTEIKAFSVKRETIGKQKNIIYQLDDNGTIWDKVKTLNLKFCRKTLKITEKEEADLFKKIDELLK